MFPTVKTPGYWSRDNVWIVVVQDHNGVSWLSAHETKAEAVENAQAWVADHAERDDNTRPDAVWVMKSPHLIASE